MQRIVIISLLFLLSLSAWAQRTPQTSQYLIHPVLVNPAAVTIRSGMSGAILFQKQWLGYENSPTSYYVNFNAPLKSQDNVVGGTVISDQVGVHSRYKIFGIYAHKFQLNQGSYISLGLSPGIDLIQSDYSKANTDFENDPILRQSNRSLVGFNSGFGVHYYNNRFWAGLSVPSLFYNYFEGIEGQKTSLALNEMTYNFVAGWKKDLGKFLTVKPSAMFRLNPGSPMQFDINALVEYREEIGIGVSYRSKSTVNFLANYRITSDFKLGYAFAMQMGSDLNDYHSGTHEIALVYGVGNNRKASINLPRKIKKYRKKKTKEIKKALKQSEKKRNKQEKEALKKERQKNKKDKKAPSIEGEEFDQPYS